MTSPTMSLVPTIELPALYDLVVRGDDDVFAFRAHSVVGAVDAHYCGFFGRLRSLEAGFGFFGSIQIWRVLASCYVDAIDVCVVSW